MFSQKLGCALFHCCWCWQFFRRSIQINIGVYQCIKLLKYFFKLERGRTLIENNIQMSFGKKVKTKKSGSRQKKQHQARLIICQLFWLVMSCLSLAMASFCSLYSQSLLIFVGWLLVGWLVIGFQSKGCQFLGICAMARLIRQAIHGNLAIAIIQWFVP